MSTPASTPLPPPPKPPLTAALTPSASSPAAAALTAGNVRSVPSPAYLSSLSSKNILSPQNTRSPQTTRSPHPNKSPKAANARSPFVQNALHQLTSAVGTPRLGVGGVGSPAATGALGLGLLGASTGMTPLGVVAEGPGSVDGATAGNLALNTRDQDKERRKKIEEIVQLMAGKRGRVSQEGVERCARRVGLEWMWEEESGKRTLSIAGSGVLVDVEFTGQEVGAVVLSFPASGDGVGKLAGRGADVLKMDLKGDENGYVMLDAFVENLERLAKMDRLGGAGLSCFDAVEGVYRCLQRVYEWEMAKLRDSRGFNNGDEEECKQEVMCKSSGRPIMHAAGQVGLALQYWQERRLVPGRKRKADEMARGGLEEEHIDSKIYSAVIECEASSSELYPSVRVSDSWVSAQVERPPVLDDPFALTSASSIDWQEPPATLLPPNPLPGAMALDPDPMLPRKPPNVRFVAHLDPPVIVPLQTAIDIYESVGAPLAQDSMQPTTYEALLFADVDPTSKPQPPSQQRQAQHAPKNRTVVGTTTSYHPSGPPSQHRHKYTLFTQPAYARTIEHIPFSHPRQLIAALPLLRQWALTGNILRRSFAGPSANKNATSPDPGLDRAVGHSHVANGADDHDDGYGDADEDALTSALAQASTLEEELAALLAGPVIRPASPPPLAVDISLSLLPSPPRLGIISERESGGTPSGLTVAIGLNGAIEVLEGGNGVNGAYANPAAVTVTQRAKRVLEIGESIGVLVTWMGGAGRARQDGDEMMMG
ncbi:hypothetical protein MMC07_006641 [Pseudocyphellaria aurata]|nr:hypothetical protein [Pseudocyphellaria aurata]